MKRLEYAPAANIDLIEIHAYSISQWGERKADDYLDALRDAIERIPDNPFAARERRNICPPVRALSVGSHLALYRIEDGTVLVIRVVHRRRNWAALLE